MEEITLVLCGRQCRAVEAPDGWEIRCPSLFLLVDGEKDFKAAAERMVAKIREDVAPEELP